VLAGYHLLAGYHPAAGIRRNDGIEPVVPGGDGCQGYQPSAATI